MLDQTVDNTFANLAYCQLLGMDREAVLARSVPDAIHPADLEATTAMIDTARSTGSSTSEQRIRHRDGHFLRVHWRVVYEPTSLGLMCVANDVTMHQERLDHLRNEVLRDPLTGAYNRAGLMKALERAVAEERSAGMLVALLDIDRFKSVNDRLGHHGGDLLLRLVVQRLAAAFDETVTIGRLGGDEFAVVAETGALESPAALGEALTQIFDHPFAIEHRVLAVKSSVGVVQAEGTESATTLLQQADAAAYEAKRRGRGQACLADAALLAARQEDIELELALGNALGTGAFVPYFQPVIDLASLQITFHESLLRWQQEHETIAPARRFLDIAMKSGLLSDISAEVRSQTFDVAAQRPDLTFSINLSSNELADRALTGHLGYLALVSGIDPGKILVEITEQTIAEDEQSAHRALRQLSEIGFGVVLDDFGSGYSSLAQIASLPVSMVKLDRSLLVGARSGGRSLQLLTAAYDLLEGLEITVIVEGVDTIEDHQLLIDLGVRYAQGHLYAWPTRTPVESIERLTPMVGLEHRRHEP